jgi:hypothetical protein
VSGWYAYDGARSNANGPNYRCPQNVITGTGSQAFTWCGDGKKNKGDPSFECDLCAESDNDFDPTGKKGKCQRISDRAQKNAKRCEKRKQRPRVIRGCCPSEDCKEARGLMKTRSGARQAAKQALDAAKLAFANAKVAKAEACPTKDKPKKAKEPPKSYTPEDFALTKANDCPAGSTPVDYKTCHDQAANYKWPGQPAGRTQRWDEEDHDPEFGTGWTFMPPGCVLYTSWPSGSHAAQVRWNPNENGKNDGHRAKVCEKGSALLQVEAEKVSDECKAARAELKTKRAELKAARAALKAAKAEFTITRTAKNTACGKKEKKAKKEPKTYTPEDFALTKANDCPEGSNPVDYKTCHDQAANYQWPGQPAGHTQRWDEEDHDPEFGTGWTFMPPGCVLYTGWPSGSHAAQVRWNPNENGKNDGYRAKVCEKSVEPKVEENVEQKLGYIQTKGVSCGWAGACGGDPNQDYINNGARQMSASASDVSSCEELCDQHDSCDGFCLVGTVCYFRKDTECNEMVPTSGRSCWQKPIDGRQCSPGQFQGGSAC